jgi:hypothetical protein
MGGLSPIIFFLAASSGAPQERILGQNAGCCTWTAALFSRVNKHFIRLAHSQLKVAPELLNAQSKAQGGTF